MNVADISIIAIAVLAAYLGLRKGTIRQFGGLVGVICAIYFAGFLYEKLAFLTQSSSIRTIVLAAVLIGAMFLVVDLFIIGAKWLQAKIPKFVGTLPDKIGGAIISFIGSIVAVWALALIFNVALPQVVRAQVENSLIFTTIAQHSNVPIAINNVSQLLKPFESPDVFVGQEPSFGNTAINRTYENLDAATASATSSIVKVLTWGCGSIGNGSGFAVGKRYIATNAHVVAGSDRISIESGGSSFVGRLVWFDPKLDFALLLTEVDLPTAPLTVAGTTLDAGAIVAVLGYPGNGDFMAGDAIILERLRADGYDIYRQKKVTRSVYALRGEVIAGNSGGPLINSEGKVVGIVFGHSTSQNKTGYAITSDQIVATVSTVESLHDLVSAGPCTTE